jgi:hypothetical protein
MVGCLHTLHTHALTHTLMHTHAHTHAYTCTHACLHMHTRMHTHAHTHAYTCTHSCIHMHTLMHTHAHTHAYTCTHSCIHMHTLMHTHARTHAYTCTHAPSFLPPLFLHSQICQCWGGDWGKSSYQTFDNFPQALLALFQISTTDGWIDLMWAAVDTAGADMQPRRDNNQVWVVNRLG